MLSPPGTPYKLLGNTPLDTLNVDQAAQTSPCGHDGQPLSRAQMMAQALEGTYNTVFITDLQSRLIYANDGCRRMFGYTEQEMIGARPSDILTRNPGVQADVVRARTRADALQATQAELLLYRKDGSPLWVSVNFNPILDQQQRPIYFVAVLTDITHAKMHEVLHKRVLDALVREEPLSQVMQAICLSLEQIAPALRATVTSVDSGKRLRVIAAPSLPSSYRDVIDGLAIGPTAGACGAAAWHARTVMVSDTATDPLFEGFRSYTRIEQLHGCWASPIKSSDGSVLGTFAFYYQHPGAPDPWHIKLAEICMHLCALALEREQTRTRMHQLAFYDPLTGLANRMMFCTLAEQMLEGAEIRNEPVAVMLMDVDRFKRINETHGHAAGDGLLREIAERIGQTLGDQDLVAHQAGGEFILALPGCDAEQATATAEKLLDVISAPSLIGGMTLHPSASIGVAIFCDDGRDISVLLRHADLAAHRAKTEGGNRLRFFSADMHQLAQERLALETDLRDAIQYGRLHLHYQPQLSSTAPHRLLGVEVLLRWKHPQLGQIPPTRFIPMAEECGLMSKLSWWVLANACRQMADWCARGIPVPWISVNLSPSNFEEPRLAERLQRLLQEHGLAPHQLVLEMTESVMLTPNPIVLQNLQAISSAGLSLSLDDFGTGYSSLSHLHRLPIDELKLDKSFVHDLEHNASARTLTNSILRIGESLGMRVVAEGVETQMQCALLAELGCQVLQGYLFSKPLAPEEFEDWLTNLGA